MVLKVLSLCFPFSISLKMSGITGYRSYCSIQTHYVPIIMGLAFVFFTLCTWGGEKHAIGSGTFQQWIVVGPIWRWGLSITVHGRVKGIKAPIVFRFLWVYLRSAQRMVYFRSGCLDAPNMASSQTVPCRVFGN